VATDNIINMHKKFRERNLTALFSSNVSGQTDKQTIRHTDHNTLRTTREKGIGVINWPANVVRNLATIACDK